MNTPYIIMSGLLIIGVIVLYILKKQRDKPTVPDDLYSDIFET